MALGDSVGVQCQPARGMAGSDSLQVDYEARIAAPVDSVFLLACPVEEYKWIPGWKCDLVHCPNQRVEQGTVFDEALQILMETLVVGM